MVEEAERPNHFHVSVNVGTVGVAHERHVGYSIVASSTLMHIEVSAVMVAAENPSFPSQAFRLVWTTLAIRSISMDTRKLTAMQVSSWKRSQSIGAKKLT